MGIFGVPNVAYSWSRLQWRWPNKPWPRELQDDMEDTLSELSMYKPEKMYWYKAECTPNASMVTRCIGGLPGAVAARCADEKFDFVEDLASAVNHCVNETLKGIVRLPFNVLSTDYVHDDVVERIIELNNEVPNGAHLSMSVTTAASASTEMLDETAYLVASSSQHPINQTMSSLSTNFSMPARSMPPVEVRETCT